MRHPSFAHELERRPLFEAAKTEAEVKALEEQWRREDEAEIAVQSSQAQQMADHERRLAVIEDILENQMVELLAHVIKTVKQDVLDQIEQRGLLTYKGVWDEAVEYRPGSFVTTVGSAWVAIAPCAKGERPGKAAGWKLAVKSPQPKEPTIA
jgi:hypothetical protein